MIPVPTSETPAVTPQELGQLLDIAAKAPVTLIQGHALSTVVNKLVALANQKHPIGALEPFKPAHEREPPHCSSCECGMVRPDTPITDAP